MRRTDRGVHPGRAADQRFHLRPLRFPSPGGGTSRSPFSKGPSFPTVIIFFLPRGLLSSLQSPARAGTGSFPDKHLWAACGRPLPYAGPLRAPHPQGDSFYGERVTRKPAKGASPLAIPLGYPPPPREKVSLRSPLSDGDKASSGTGLPIQEATTEGRSLSWVLIDRSPGNQQSGLFRGITPGSLVSSYHQYSSEYSAGTCPV